MKRLFFCFCAFVFSLFFLSSLSLAWDTQIWTLSVGQSFTVDKYYSTSQIKVSLFKTLSNTSVWIAVEENGSFGTYILKLNETSKSGIQLLNVHVKNKMATLMVPYFPPIGEVEIHTTTVPVEGIPGDDVNVGHYSFDFSGEEGVLESATVSFNGDLCANNSQWLDVSLSIGTEAGNELLGSGYMSCPSYDEKQYIGFSLANTRITGEKFSLSLELDIPAADYDREFGVTFEELKVVDTKSEQSFQVIGLPEEHYVLVKQSN